MIARVVREWPQWSPAERRKMDAVIGDVIDHCANGTGNRFIREWVNRVLVPQVPGMVAR
jgi:hypothetical protein